MKEFDELLNLKKKIEEFSPTLLETYNNINKIIENLDCLDTDKFDQIMSLLKEYSADIEKIKTDFLLLKITHTRMEACLNETKILKKKRLFRLEKVKNNREAQQEIDELDSFFDVL